CPCPCPCPYSCPLSLSLPFLPHNELEGARLRDAGARHEPRATRAALLDPERPPPPTPTHPQPHPNPDFSETGSSNHSASAWVLRRVASDSQRAFRWLAPRPLAVRLRELRRPARGERAARWAQSSPSPSAGGAAFPRRSRR